MAYTLTGTLHGDVITLDRPEGARQGEDGQRVRVAVEPLDDAELELSASKNEELLKVWAANGPQGPIDDEGEPEFP